MIFQIAGEPRTWNPGDQNQKEWTKTVRDGLESYSPAWQLASLASPCGVTINFFVSDWQRFGNYFDLDNLVIPVFEAIFNSPQFINKSNFKWWSASMAVGPCPGVLVGFWDNAERHKIHYGWNRILSYSHSGNMPQNSQAGADEGIPENIRKKLPANYSPSDADRFSVIIRLKNYDIADVNNFLKPIKPIIDCLYPVFGGEGGVNKNQKDHKIHFLHVERVDNLAVTFEVEVWTLSSVTQTQSPTADVSVPQEQKAEETITQPKVWVNIDKPTRRCKIGETPICPGKETPYKGVGELKRDGGWLPFNSRQEAEEYCRKNFPNYSLR